MISRIKKEKRKKDNNEQGKSFLELQNRIEKMSNELDIYNREQVAIVSSGQMDVDLRRSTHCPSIGIEFFIVDDEHFQDEFEDLRYDEIVFIRGRSIEETVYCILNELWRLNDKRPIYVVKNLESWKKLQVMGHEENIYCIGSGISKCPCSRLHPTHIRLFRNGLRKSCTRLAQRNVPG